VIKNIINDIIEYIDLERASCLGNGGIKNIINYIVEYIDLERASCLGNGGLRILLKLLWNILM
jgi:hypothetical protein